MRSTTRYMALGFTGVLLAACGHKDKDAPLAFVPADTPYVVANLDVLDDNARNALLAQYDAQLPGQMVQLKTVADDMVAKDPDTARLLKAFIAELDGKTIETFAQNTGLDLKGHSAFYGLGLSPVVRYELTDSKAFEGFVGRLEAAYGKKFDIAAVGGQSYRKHIFDKSGTQIILAIVGKQAIAAILPSDAAQPMLRLTLGLDRPEKNIQDDGRLERLANAKGYQPWAIGQLDIVHTMALAASGKDPIFNALVKAYVEDQPVTMTAPAANRFQIPPSCATDASRIAARIPSVSFGYTKFNTKHQDLRLDVALADDITKAFSGMKVELPGLGQVGNAPFDLSLAVPVAQLRKFWGAQADAVAAKPFICPTFSELNDAFAKIGEASQQASLPPFGDLLGLHVSLDTLNLAEPDSSDSKLKLSGRSMIATSNPSGLVTMGGMISSAITALKLTPDGKPVALPAEVTEALGMPAWAAMSDKGLAFAVGQGEDSKLTDTLKAPTGDAGRFLRMHLNGDMYQTWVKAMEQQSARITALNKSPDESDEPDGDATAAQAKQEAAAAHLKSAFDSMLIQAARINAIDAEAHFEDSGLVITGQTELK
ncbi:MAG: hypothetical protein WAM90_05580 [Rhodanobacter sp.]